MKNQKIFSALMTLFVSAFAVLPAFAADEYLPDVENVSVIATEAGVQLSWSPVTGANQYSLYYGTSSINVDGASYESNILLDNVTQYVLTGLIPETKYYFAIAADDSTGTKFGSYNYSQEVSVTTLPEVAPEVVTPTPVVDPLADFPQQVNPVTTPEVDPTATQTTDPASELVGEEFNSSGKNAPSTQPTDLPKSGPEMAVVFLMSGTGAYFWRRFQRK